MILPTSTTVAVADGETVRLFHNTGVKPGSALGRDHGGSACARPTQAWVRAITPALPTPMAGGSSRTTSRQRRPRS